MCEEFRVQTSVFCDLNVTYLISTINVRLCDCAIVTAVQGKGNHGDEPLDARCLMKGMFLSSVAIVEGMI